jgi:hypothetical protein
MMFVAALRSDCASSNSCATAPSVSGESEEVLIRRGAEKTLREKCGSVADVQKNEFECKRASYFLK